MKASSKSGAAHAALFNEPAEPTWSGVHVANVDGGARGNPGPAAYGIVLRGPDGKTLLAAGKYVGRATNNVAEYYGLIAALDAAAQRGVRRLRVESDSELLVRQMQGRYRVKSPDLKPLYERATKLSRGFDWFRIEHVPRERNHEADRLVNAALDGGSGETRRTAEAKPGTGRERVVQALVKDGLLVPVEPLSLPEGTKIRIKIEPAE